MIDYQKIIDFYYPEDKNPKLRKILMEHSRCVAELAVEICRKHKELNADEDFVYAAAMLHDIGIVRCDADGIHCYGKEPYICHGTLGAKMLNEVDFGLDTKTKDALSRVCARHTGTGLTADQIMAQSLPLPHCDLIPETTEEKIVCYADKFFSKTHTDRKKTFEKAKKSLIKFGEKGVDIFTRWHEEYNVE